MTRCAYQGAVPVMLPDYIDQDTGRVLTAEPGGTYDITPASGRMVPDIPTGFAPAGDDVVIDVPVENVEYEPPPEGGEG